MKFVFADTFYFLAAFNPNDQIRASPVWEIVPASSMFFDRALQLYDQHRDKEWAFTDCTSFVVMKERGINEAQTGDHHFEQAGFIALLK